MKKLQVILTLTALLAFGLKAMAQSFNAGLLAGANFSQVDGDSYFGYNQLGWTAGVFVNLPFSDYFSGQMELRYSLMGAHSSVKEVRR